MDLSFTSEEEQLRQKVRNFLAEEMPKSGLKSASEGREDKAWLGKGQGVAAQIVRRRLRRPRMAQGIRRAGDGPRQTIDRQ